LLEESEEIHRGIKKDSNVAYLDKNALMASIKDIKSADATKISDKTSKIVNAINTMADDLASRSSNPDKIAIKLDFLQSIITKLMTAITSSTFSPKVLIVFAMSAKIMNDGGIPSNIVDFIKKYINIYKSIISKIRDVVVKEITKKITDLMIPFAREYSIGLIKEQAANYRAQMAVFSKLIDSIL
jgi:hypothetical protein